MTELLKFIHMAALLSAVGLFVFSYIHFVRSVVKRFFDPEILKYLHQNFDTAFFIAWCLSLLFGLALVYPKGYTITTPWIQAALLFMGVSSLLWVVSLFCKYRLLHSLISNQARRIRLWFFYHMTHAFIF